MGGWCGPSFTTASIRRERHEHRYPQVNKSWSQPIPGFVEGRLASGEHRLEVLANALTVLTTIALCLSDGALVTATAVLISTLRSLQTDRLSAWFTENARLLSKFFGPLSVIALV